MLLSNLTLPLKSFSSTSEDYVSSLSARQITPPNSEIICGRNVSTKVVCGIILFFEKRAMLKI